MLEERPDVEDEEVSSRSVREEAPWLVCADCGNPIARRDAAISVNRAHEHEFVNPSAEVFRVRCFSSAPGAMPVGERSTTWTWFPGHAWQIRLCRRCAGHVGWSFHRGEAEFYGLVSRGLR